MSPPLLFCFLGRVTVSKFFFSQGPLKPVSSAPELQDEDKPHKLVSNPLSPLFNVGVLLRKERQVKVNTVKNVTHMKADMTSRDWIQCIRHDPLRSEDPVGMADSALSRGFSGLGSHSSL